MRRMLCDKKWANKGRFLTLNSSFFEQSVQDYAEHNSLLLIKNKKIPLEKVFNTDKDFSFFLEHWLGLIKIPKEIRDDFLQALEYEYLKSFPPAREGKIHFIYEERQIEIKQK
jgi:hypothetical protein